MSTLSEQTANDLAVPDRIGLADIREAHREVVLAVQRGLAARWDQDSPSVAVVERNGVATVYVSTAAGLSDRVRTDIRSAVRSALAEYLQLAPFTNVVFLTRGCP